MPSCPICQSSDVKTDFTVGQWLNVNQNKESPVHKFVHLVEKNNGYGIKEINLCRHCGFRFASPYPDDQNLSKYYSEYYANQNYSSKKEKKIKRARKRIRFLNRRGQHKSFLDVGCNIGAAVEAARLEGLEACGIEIDAESIEFAQQYFPDNEFHVVSIQEFAKTNRQFDIIYSTEVVEHLNDPHSFFEAAHKLLSPQGVFYITTPDGAHFRTPKKEKIMQWHEMKLPEHISLFSKKSLRYLLEQHGFERPFFIPNMKAGIRSISRKKA